MIGLTIDEHVGKVYDGFSVPQVLKGADFMSVIFRDFILRFWHLCAV